MVLVMIWGLGRKLHSIAGGEQIALLCNIKSNGSLAGFRSFYILKMATWGGSVGKIMV